MLAIIGLISAAIPLVLKGIELIQGGQGTDSIWASIIKAIGVIGQATDLLTKAMKEGRDVTNAERDAVIAESRRLFAELDAELTAAAAQT